MNDEAKLPFRKTPVWFDIQSTILSGPKSVNFDTRVLINTDKGSFNVIKVLEFQEKCDYVKDVGPEKFIRFLIGAGDYVYKLYPYRDTLNVTVKKLPQSETMGEETEEESLTTRYRAILDMDKNPSVTGQRSSTLDYQSLQTSNQIVEVRLELQDRNYEVLRLQTVQGDSYRGVTPEQLIYGLMVGESQKFNIDGEPAIRGFDFVKPDNSAAMGNVTVPTMKIGNVPTFIQEKLNGVYNAGIGTFYERYKGIPSWFVYPLFKTQRFDDDVERVVFFIAPPNELSGLDRTYRKAGKILYIAVTGDVIYSDDSQIGDLNKGVGFRQADANGIFSKPIDMTPAGPVADRARLNREIAARERKDGLYYAPTLAPSVNPFKNYSQIAARQVSQVNIVWENSKPEYIYPGMPCKYVFMNAGEYIELKGTVLGKYSRSTLIGAAATSSSYRTSTQLGLCLEYFKVDPEQPVMNSPGNF